MPTVDGEAENRIPLKGDIPSPKDPPPGCVFHTRCHRFIEGTCDKIEPPMVEVNPGHSIKCHIPPDELRELQKEPWVDHSVPDAEI